MAAFMSLSNFVFGEPGGFVPRKLDLEDPDRLTLVSDVVSDMLKFVCLLVC